MAHINLLPWREEQRLQKNKEFISLVVMIALLAGLAVAGTLFFFNNRLNDQKSANELIATKNQQLDVALKEIESLERRKEEIIARMKVIQDLQGKRPIPVRVWDDLARAIPEMLFLTKLERKGDKLILSGKAENPNIVSALINNLDRSRWMDDSSVQFIEKGEDVKVPDKKSQEIIYPEDSYVGFQVTTVIQMSTKKGEGKKAEGAGNSVATSVDNSQVQVPQADSSTATTNDETQAQVSDNASTTNGEAQSQQTNGSTEETAGKSQEPQQAEKESDDKTPVKQENAEKSQTSDKAKTGEDDTSNASKDNTAENSDDTAKDSGGDT